ncbi:hypothetical protein BDW59DRAFT_164413 [Aspergillus cavernicola]|uniref:Uncharacterized protein n=1 Tax=Aspergillus cavernicola TaxID=176166 RepID=A0ABR4I2A3_9EURO
MDSGDYMEGFDLPLGPPSFPDPAITPNNEDHMSSTTVIRWNTPVHSVGYLGVVHQLRKRAEKTNTPVYGFATDGFDFYFFMIGEESVLQQAKKLNQDDGEQKLVIYSTLQAIVRQVRELSPMHTRQHSEK